MRDKEKLEELISNEEKLQEVLDILDRISIVSARLARNIKILAERNQ